MATAFNEQIFQGKCVLVTGATSGIGEATAIAFSEAGANVMLSGRNVERGQALVKRLSGNPGRTEFVGGDVSGSEFCNELVTQTFSLLGKLDIVVNSAGVIYLADVETTTDQQWLHTFDVNVHGMFYVCRAAITRMKNSGGVILNIASDAGLSASSDLTAYCASKGAAIQMSRAMAKDYGKYDIRVIPICPGDVDTSMLRGEFGDRGIDVDTGLRLSAESVPINKVCRAEDVAQLILFAASDSARYMTGFPLVMDGGSRA